jgi:hypothetical protein
MVLIVENDTKNYVRRSRFVYLANIRNVGRTANIIFYKFLDLVQQS